MKKHHRRHSGFSRLRRKAGRFFVNLVDASGRFPLYGLLLLFVFFPLCYAGGALWWLPAALTWTLFIYAVWLLSEVFQGGSRLSLRFHPGMLLLLLPLLAGMFQLLPLGNLVRVLSPATWESWNSMNAIGIGTSAARLTLAPDATHNACQLLLLCLLVFFLLYQYSRHRHDLLLIMAAIVCSALGNALIAYWQFFSLQSGSGLETVFTGTFHNRNHFGFMMSMGILAAVGLLSTLKKESNRKFSAFKEWQVLRIPLLLCVFLLVIAQVLSLSRGAFLATSLMLCIYAMIWWLPDRYGHGTHKTFPALIILVMGALLFALQSGLSMLAERYEVLIGKEIFDSDLRFSFWKDTLKLASDFPLTGTGFGAYRDAIQAYESGRVTDVLIDHAHNDWLELIAEGGWPLATILVFALFLLLWKAGRKLWRQQDPTLRWCGFAALAAILAGLIHECFDFNLQALSNAILFSALLAVLFSCARTNTDQRPQQPNQLRLPRLALLLMGFLLLLLVIPLQVRKTHSAALHAIVREGLLKREQNWEPKRNDYLRWLNLADKALQATPNLASLRLRKAVCATNLAAYELDKATAFWQSAMADSAAACRRAPNNGEFFLNCAQIHELGSESIGMEYEATLIRLYDRAYLCHPRLVSTVLSAAEALRRIYWRIFAQADQETAAASVRLRAMQLFSEYLRLAPNQASQVFAQITELSNDPDELLKIAPKNLLMQRQLLEYLFDRQNYQKAFALLEANRADWLAGSQEDCASPVSTTARDWYEWQCTLLGLTGQWQQRNEILQEFRRLATLNHEQKIPDLMQQHDDDALHSAELTFTTLNRQPPLSFEVLLRHAEMLQHYGRHGEICTTLLPFAYANPPPPLEYLEKAFKVLNFENDHGEIAPTERELFLKIALDVILAEARKSATDPAGLVELRKLEQTPPEKARDPWLQNHLYPFFQGRIHCLRREFAEASDAYRRSMLISPHNLLVWEFWQKLPEKFRPAENPTWVSELEGALPMNFQFSNALSLLFVRSTPQQITKFHETTELEFFWLCTGDILEDGQARITFHNASGMLFEDRFSFLDLQYPMVNWRIGELVTCKRTYRPLLQSIQNGKPVNDSTVIAQLKMASLFKNSGRIATGVPRAVFSAFQMKRPTVE